MISNSPDNQITQDMVEQLLHHIRSRFYTGNEIYYRDRKMLLYSITWPAKWLKDRGLSTSNEKYKTLVIDILKSINKYGDRKNYQEYFPRYLLKCIQNHLSHNEDKLYMDLKHIRNALQSALNHHKSRQQYDQNEQMITVLTQVHSITNPSKSKKSPQNNPKQMLLL